MSPTSGVGALFRTIGHSSPIVTMPHHQIPQVSLHRYMSTQLPESIDLREYLDGYKVLNQGYHCTCWAFVVIRSCSFHRFEFYYSKKLSETVTSNFFATVKNSHIKSHLNSNQRTKRSFKVFKLENE